MIVVTSALRQELCCQDAGCMGVHACVYAMHSVTECHLEPRVRKTSNMLTGDRSTRMTPGSCHLSMDAPRFVVRITRAGDPGAICHSNISG